MIRLVLIYAIFGGVSIAMSPLWGRGLDGDRPDRPGFVGSLIALVGVRIMMYWPRG